ncbi:DUF4360 domain-containing protein [Catenuloplanes atrovinosus]|uniref:DUF4360 domain-containing protein n=1 Tax=Catenuloplanes atrovinosus TaxID=137266 RepID=A0AAE3YMD4_9ACTN|nr:DUF4360 domain-containing protein [Catenuloplanes atrovinosus]MDR7275707.1 hypothetical protein [Catenuloplanes atrovinosus]
MKRNPAGARHAVIIALGTVLALPLSAPARADGDETAAAVPDGNVTVEVVAASGSGCSPGTASVVAKPDKSGFRIRYYDFVAYAGGGAAVAERRKNCQIGVLVTVPAGWTFAVAEAEYRGRARLQPGATGLQRTNYYWQGSSDNSSTEDTFYGPLGGYWSTRDVAPVLVYRPCATQRVLNINTELRVDAGASGYYSSMSMNSSEGDVDTLFNFTWTQC